uniref:DUF1279 domain-containing protein n=1 Tax=Octactis speculum TaxID=3111310 RepID=A0A7S2FL17_9STRA
MLRSFFLALFLARISSVAAFTHFARSKSFPTHKLSAKLSGPSVLILRMAEESQDPKINPEIEEATLKYGVEGGLFESMKRGDLPQATELLKKYGGAYIITSVTFAIISFSICYTLIDQGVDVGALLEKVGIAVDSGSVESRAGTFALAYAIHKAASPIRFPPTVLLTPVVAEWLGKEVVTEDPSSDDGNVE